MHTLAAAEAIDKLGSATNFDSAGALESTQKWAQSAVGESGKVN